MVPVEIVMGLFLIYAGAGLPFATWFVGVQRVRPFLGQAVRV